MQFFKKLVLLTSIIVLIQVIFTGFSQKTPDLDCDFWSKSDLFSNSLYRIKLNTLKIKYPPVPPSKIPKIQFPKESYITPISSSFKFNEAINPLAGSKILLTSNFEFEGKDFG
jgi:hypothetical protein